MAPVAVSMSGHPTTTTQHQFEYPSAAAAASLPSPYTDPNHVSPNPLAQHMENWCYITDNAFDVLRHDIYSDPEFLALGSDFTDPKVQATVVDITNRCVRDFKRSVLEEIDSWRATLFSELKVEAPKRERPGELHEGGRAKKHKVNGSVDYDDEEEEDGEFVNSKNPGWQCLFFEHDPRAHPQCGQRRYKRVSELRRHIKTHTLPHHCETCGYRTAEERRLGSHKCDDGNKKKYQPVTAEDKVKHERLAKMGVKVGEMRLILFGDAANGHGASPDANANSFVPSNFSGFGVPAVSMPMPPVSNGNIMASNFAITSVNATTTMASATFYPTADEPISPHSKPMLNNYMTPNIAHQQQFVPQPPTPPFQGPGHRFHHNPSTGHANEYYSSAAEDTHAHIFAYAAAHTVPQQGSFGDFPLYPDSSSPSGPSPPPAAMGHGLPLSHPGQMTPMGLQNHSPVHPHFPATTTAPLPPSHQPLKDYIEGLFGSSTGLIGMNMEHTDERRMPESEIKKMEENIRKMTPEQRGETLKMLARGPSFRERVAEKTKRLFALPVRGGPPERAQVRSEGTQTPVSRGGSEASRASQREEEKKDEGVKKEESDSDKEVKKEETVKEEDNDSDEEKPRIKKEPADTPDQQSRRSKSSDRSETTSTAAIKTAAAVTVKKVEEEEKPVVVEVRKDESLSFPASPSSPATANTFTPARDEKPPKSASASSHHSTSPPQTARSSTPHQHAATTPVSLASSTSSTSPRPSPPAHTSSAPVPTAEPPSLWRRLSKRAASTRHHRTRSFGTNSDSEKAKRERERERVLGGGGSTVTVIEGGVREVVGGEEVGDEKHEGKEEGGGVLERILGRGRRERG
ncbi:hypothetical protein EX30DRAFT_373158 [Ascodesmis nigricans]|uniref:Uncharacterized protein n=1 Tax=Ascodesmis nigricans TaxID=341454 RepID=A0A4S2MSV0_9PEZI|nr:hypothetical protein EX30DRAFT_373158 [Ascodesmis nigricans]